MEKVSEKINDYKDKKRKEENSMILSTLENYTHSSEFEFDLSLLWEEFLIFKETQKHIEEEYEKEENLNAKNNEENSNIPPFKRSKFHKKMVCKFILSFIEDFTEEMEILNKELTDSISDKIDFHIIQIRKSQDKSLEDHFYTKEEIDSLFKNIIVSTIIEISNQCKTLQNVNENSGN